MTMPQNHCKVLGLSKENSLDEKFILKNFRKKLNDGSMDINILSESALILMQSCQQMQMLTGIKIQDEVYNNMIQNSENENGILKMNIIGFNSIAHNGLVTVLKKKFGKYEGAVFENTFCEIPFDFVQLPFDRSGLPKKFPPIKLCLISTEESLKCEIKGESGIIFVLFHMKSILSQFVKKIPGLIGDSYATPNRPAKNKTMLKKQTTDFSSSSSCSFISTSSESSQRTSPLIVVTPPRTSPLILVTPPKSPSVATSPTPPPSPVFHTRRRNTRPVMPPQPIFTRSSSQRLKSSVSDTTSADKPSLATIEVTEEKCCDCAIIDVGINIDGLVNQDEFKIVEECSGKCVEEHKDSLKFFIDQLLKLTFNKTLLDVDSMPRFKQNMKTVMEIFEQMPDGPPGFFCCLLDLLPSILEQNQERLIVVLRELIDVCFNEDFEKTLIKNKKARRNLHKYLKKTGSIFSVLSVIEMFYKMFLKSVNLKKILPPAFGNISELFSAETTDAKTGISNHMFLAHVSREIIKNVYKGKNIEFFEVKSKSFRLGDKTLEISGDNYIYTDKKNSLFYHFIFMDNEIYAEPIKFLDVCLVKTKQTIIMSPKWIFYLNSDSMIENLRIQDENPSSKDETPTSKDETPTSKDETLNSKDETPTSKDEAPTSKDETPTSNVSEGSNSVLQSNSDAESDTSHQEDGDTRNVALAEIVIKTADISQYWDAKPNKRRKFVAGLVGADWPTMYGSPCAVVVDYNHVKVIGSQKRSCDFAKIVGKCKICNAEHTFMIETNPFKETILNDQTIEYTAVKDMSVFVTVIGRFDETIEGNPDITKPKHDLRKSAGLQLKGRARRLVANRATDVGVKSTYLEQLDYAQEHQIQFGNKTSLNSMPVIKQARLEQEKKSRCGKDFYESAYNVFVSQVQDISPNFDDTAISRKFPGFIR